MKQKYLLTQPQQQQLSGREGHELEDSSLGCTWSEHYREKFLNRNEQSLGTHEAIVKDPTFVPLESQRTRRKTSAQNKLEELVAKRFPNLAEDTDI